MVGRSICGCEAHHCRLLTFACLRRYEASKEKTASNIWNKPRKETIAVTISSLLFAWSQRKFNGLLKPIVKFIPLRSITEALIYTLCITLCVNEKREAVNKIENRTDADLWQIAWWWFYPIWIMWYSMLNDQIGTKVSCMKRSQL